MKFMVMVKATQASENGVLPSQDLLEAMGRYNQELIDAGIMQAGEGLQSSAKGARVHFSGKDRSVTYGPFDNTRELIAGFWIWKIDSLEDAIAWVKRCPNPMMEDSDIEIRQIFEMEDFAEKLTPELRAQEERQREQIGNYA